MVQIFLIYFALPMITGQRIDPFIAAVTACSINSGAYVSEIFRAGIQSIDKGQMEAGRSLWFNLGSNNALYHYALKLSKQLFHHWVTNLLPC